MIFVCLRCVGCCGVVYLLLVAFWVVLGSCFGFHGLFGFLCDVRFGVN